MLSPPSFLKQLAEAVFQHILSTPHKEAFIWHSILNQIPYDKLPSYTLLVAGAVYKAIKNLTLIDISIKWVNDISKQS